MNNVDLDNIEAAAKAGFAHPADTLKLVAMVRRLQAVIRPRVILTEPENLERARRLLEGVPTVETPGDRRCVPMAGDNSDAEQREQGP